MVQYTVAKFYAELHSAAIGPVSYGPLGDPVVPPEAWPPLTPEDPESWKQNAREVSDDARLIDIYTAETLRVTSFVGWFERADLLYSAASFGWDLGHLRSNEAGTVPEELTVQGYIVPTMIGKPQPNLAAYVLQRENIQERSGRMATFKQQCGNTGLVQELLHPWLPGRVADVYRLLLDGSVSEPTAELQRLMQNPEQTIVIHLRLGDIAHESRRQIHRRKGRPLEMRLPNWLWMHSWQDMDVSGKAREDSLAMNILDWTTADPQLELHALEFYAANKGHVALPLSFYQAILDKLGAGATGSAGLHVHLVTEPDSVNHPLVQALQQQYGATVQAETAALDFATLMYARTLVCSVSTFCFMAALLGRAATVHWPHAGGLITSLQGCMIVPPELDSRIVFHDAYRVAVDKTVEAFSHNPPRPKDVEVGLTRQDPEEPMPQRSPGCPQNVPTSFLTFQQLYDFYSNPDCAAFYSPDDYAKAGSPADAMPLCVDDARNLWKPSN